MAPSSESILRLTLIVEALERKIERFEHQLENLPQELAHTLHSETLDLVRHVRYWRTQMANGEGTGPHALPPPPPSGAYALQQNDPTGAFALKHTDGRQRVMAGIAEAVWFAIKKGWPAILAAGTGWVVHVIEAVKHAR